MILYNATKTVDATPRAGMLDGTVLWPKDQPRTKVPPDDAIRAALHVTGEAACYYVDDAHHLSRTELAQLLQRAATLSGKPVVLYGWPGSAGYVRNLIMPWNYKAATTVLDNARAMASTPVWQNRPLGHYSAAICPSCYLGAGVNQYAENLDLFTAWQMVTDHSIYAAQLVAVALNKEIWPVAWLDPALGIDPQRVVDHFANLGVPALLLWDGPGGTSALNKLL